MLRNADLRRTTRRLIAEASGRAADLRRTVDETRKGIEESRRLLASYHPPASLNDLIAAPSTAADEGSDQQG